MDNLSILNELTWHDGRILDIHLALDFSREGEIEIRLSLLESLGGKKRNQYVIAAQNPVRFFSNMDITLMRKNFQFGNIADGKLYKEGRNKKLVITLAEGYIEVIGPHLTVKKMNRKTASLAS